MTEVTREMPRSRSTAIQSDRVLRTSRLALTWPASWIAPPNSSSFSVSVVLPASGWEMMANVRRRAVSCPVEVMNLSRCLGGLKLPLQHDGVFTPIGGLIIPAANADLFEPEPLIEPYG